MSPSCFTFRTRDSRPAIGVTADALGLHFVSSQTEFSFAGPFGASNFDSSIVLEVLPSSSVVELGGHGFVLTEWCVDSCSSTDPLTTLAEFPSCRYFLGTIGHLCTGLEVEWFTLVIDSQRHVFGEWSLQSSDSGDAILGAELSSELDLLSAVFNAGAAVELLPAVKVQFVADSCLTDWVVDRDGGSQLRV